MQIACHFWLFSVRLVRVCGWNWQIASWISWINSIFLLQKRKGWKQYPMQTMAEFVKFRFNEKTDDWWVFMKSICFKLPLNSLSAFWTSNLKRVHPKSLKGRHENIRTVIRVWCVKQGNRTVGGIWHFFLNKSRCSKSVGVNLCVHIATSQCWSEPFDPVIWSLLVITAIIFHQKQHWMSFKSPWLPPSMMLSLPAPRHPPRTVLTPFLSHRRRTSLTHLPPNHFPSAPVTGPYAWPGSGRSVTGSWGGSCIWVTCYHCQRIPQTNEHNNKSFELSNPVWSSQGIHSVQPINSTRNNIISFMESWHQQAWAHWRSHIEGPMRAISPSEVEIWLGSAP